MKILIALLCLVSQVGCAYYTTTYSNPNQSLANAGSSIQVIDAVNNPVQSSQLGTAYLLVPIIAAKVYYTFIPESSN